MGVSPNISKQIRSKTLLYHKFSLLYFIRDTLPNKLAFVSNFISDFRKSFSNFRSLLFFLCYFLEFAQKKTDWILESLEELLEKFLNIFWRKFPEALSEVIPEWILEKFLRYLWKNSRKNKGNLWNCPKNFFKLISGKVLKINILKLEKFRRKS